MVAETQIKLSPQHYMDQLPRQEAEQEAEYEEETEPLTVAWQDEDGRDTVTIQGMHQHCYWLVRHQQKLQVQGLYHHCYRLLTAPAETVSA